MDGRKHVLAAHIMSDKDNAKLNAIFVADIDMISDFFFTERNFGNLDLVFDNVTFVLNVLDQLAASPSQRRPRRRHR